MMQEAEGLAQSIPKPESKVRRAALLNYFSLFSSLSTLL